MIRKKFLCGPHFRTSQVTLSHAVASEACPCENRACGIGEGMPAVCQPSDSFSEALFMDSAPLPMLLVHPRVGVIRVVLIGKQEVTVGFSRNRSQVHDLMGEMIKRVFIWGAGIAIDFQKKQSHGVIGRRCANPSTSSGSPCEINFLKIYNIENN